MDTGLYGLNASKVAYIISNHWQKISDAILAYDRGVTILNATGAYSGSEKHVLMVASASGRSWRSRRSSMRRTRRHFDRLRRP